MKLGIDRVIDEASDPALRERLTHILKDPIILNPTDYTRDRIAPPTPLDPDGIYMSETGWDTHVGRYFHRPYENYTFRQFALDNAARQVQFMHESGLLPECVTGLIGAEAITQINNRADHNAESMVRLAAALTARPPKDDSMLDIVHRARAGMATLPELVRIIKEYPEIVSIETSNTQNILNGGSINNPVRAAYEMAGWLVSNFNDARITLGSNVPPKISQSAIIEGIEIKKTVIAEIESDFSHTLLKMKQPSFKFNNMVWPMGVTTYLCTVDHNSRPGYHDEDAELLADVAAIDPEDARRIIGAHVAQAAGVKLT